jgi:hypothetical protein
LTRNHCRDIAEFEGHLSTVNQRLAALREEHPPQRRIGPVAANLPLHDSESDMRAYS